MSSQGFLKEGGRGEIGDRYADHRSQSLEGWEEGGRTRRAGGLWKLERQGNGPPLEPRKEPSPDDTLMLDFWPPELQENKSELFKATKFVLIWWQQCEMNVGTSEHPFPMCPWPRIFALVGLSRPQSLSSTCLPQTLLRSPGILRAWFPLALYSLSTLYKPVSLICSVLQWVLHCPLLPVGFLLLVIGFSRLGIPHFASFSPQKPAQGLVNSKQFIETN